MLFSTLDETAFKVFYAGFRESYLLEHNSSASEEEIRLAFEQFRAKDELYETKYRIVHACIFMLMLIKFLVPGVILALLGIHFGWNHYFDF